MAKRIQKTAATRDLHKPTRIGDETAATILRTVARYGAVRFDTTVAKTNCLRAVAMLVVGADDDPRAAADTDDTDETDDE